MNKKLLQKFINVEIKLIKTYAYEEKILSKIINENQGQQLLFKLFDYRDIIANKELLQMEIDFQDKYLLYKEN